VVYRAEIFRAVNPKGGVRRLGLGDKDEFVVLGVGVSAEQHRVASEPIADLTHDPQIEQVAIELCETMWVARGLGAVADGWGRDCGHDSSPLVGDINGSGVQPRSTLCLAARSTPQRSATRLTRAASVALMLSPGSRGGSRRTRVHADGPLRTASSCPYGE